MIKVKVKELDWELEKGWHIGNSKRDKFHLCV
jgi:hypothetical protein